MAYTSFGTRRALGRRYSIDPALLLELERLNQQYALAPGREARGMQAQQFQQSLAQNESQFNKNLAFQNEQLKQQGKASMVGTVGNVLTTGALLRGMTKEKGESFFGGLLGGGKATTATKEVVPTTTYVQPQSYVPSQTGPESMYYNLRPDTRTPGEFYSGLKPDSYEVYPAQTDISAAGMGAGAGVSYGPTVAMPASESFSVTPSAYDGMSFTAGEGVPATTGGTASGILGGVGTAVPYYGLAKAGGAIGQEILKDQKFDWTGPGYFKGISESLERPLNVEQYWAEKAGAPEIVKTIFDILNPLAPVERVVSDAVGTVICTELHRQGYLTDEQLQKDAEFGKKQDMETLIGYRTWAVHVVRLMQKSRTVTAIVKPFALAWAKNMCGEKNIIGQTINTIGIPICRLIGRMKLTRPVEV